MRDLALAWYAVLNSLYVAVSQPFGEFTTSGSLVTAILLGVLGAASPCQLSTNASSIAYLLGRVSPSRLRILGPAAAYVTGKVLVYSSAGLAMFLLGEGLRTAAIPVVVVARRILGPLMILIGLTMLGVWRPRLAVGQVLSLHLRQRIGGSGSLSAFLLGVAFSFAFCPTLALLFFGYVVPMAVASQAGPLYPAAFALGTTFPLLLTVAVVAAGSNAATIEPRLASWEPRLRKAAGVIFLLAGLNDTVLYWLL